MPVHGRDRREGAILCKVGGDSSLTALISGIPSHRVGSCTTHGRGGDEGHPLHACTVTTFMGQHVGK